MRQERAGASCPFFWQGVRRWKQRLCYWLERSGALRIGCYHCRLKVTSGLVGWACRLPHWLLAGLELLASVEY